MGVMLARMIIACGLVASSGGDRDVVVVRVPMEDDSKVNVADVVPKLAAATGVEIPRPKGDLKLPVTGVGGSLTRTMLAETLGPRVKLSLEARSLLFALDPALLTPEARPDWEKRLKNLAETTQREIDRIARYGMHALESYRPNDPARPTVCLIHGINSGSHVFVHMIPLLEKAGFGLVVYDYPYNRDLDESCAEFARDWKAFRLKTGDTRPWAIVAHSMGCLVGRSYAEAPDSPGNDVSSLILIGPVNQGSNLARAQVARQFFDRASTAKDKSKANTLSHLGDGLGEAVKDMVPGSAFLKSLNSRPRRAGVAYHILAGDDGFLSSAMRKQLDDGRGLFGSTIRRMSDLDEFTEGLGDGCVSVARTRLDGVSDHVTIHANHAELIRAPLLYPDPGPVVCMPYVLRWLGKPEPGPGQEAVPGR